MNAKNYPRICMLLFSSPYYVQGYARSLYIEVYINHFGSSLSWVFPCYGKEELGCYEAAIHPIPCRQSSSLMGKLLNRVLLAYRTARTLNKLFQEQNFHIIQANENALDGLVSLYIARKFRVPFVFKWDNPLEPSFVSGKLYSWLAKLESVAVRYIVPRADLILPISESLKEDLIKLGVDKSRIWVLSCGVNPELFSPDRDFSDISSKYNLHDSKVIIYVGAIAKRRQLDVLLRAFSGVKRARRGVKLLVVGDGTERVNLERLAEELGVRDDVVFSGLIPYSHVPDFIAAADIGISSIPPLPEYVKSSPIKLFEYMAMAKPVVANEEIVEHRIALEKSRGGILTPFNEEALAEALLQLLDNPEEAIAMGQRGREWVVKNRNYKSLAQQIEGRYLELLGGR